jgi:Do/DeqQ family serine protease
MTKFFFLFYFIFAYATTSYAPIIKNSAPAVVNIFTKTITSQKDNFFDFFLKDFFKNQERGSAEKTQQSLGSGVIIQKEGLIITNNHVVTGSSEIKVVLNDGRQFCAKILANDPQSDLALLKLENTSNKIFQTMEIDDTESYQIGDIVLAIGNPFGIGQTVTHGIISALNRDGEYIQTDAAMNPGNSGGALINMKGQLIGINTFIKSTNGISNNIGFAIPAKLVKAVIASVDKGGKVERPWIGLNVQSINQPLADGLGLGKPFGVIVNSVHSKSPANKSNIKEKDIILAIDNKEIQDDKEFKFRIASAKIDESLLFKIKRASEELNISVKLVNPPEEPLRKVTQIIEEEHPLSGLVVANLSPALATELGIDEYSGVVVLNVNSNTNAHRFGFKPNDIIIHAGDEDKTVESVDILKTISKQSPKSPFILSIKRRGEVIQRALYF